MDRFVKRILFLILAFWLLTGFAATSVQKTATYFPRHSIHPDFNFLTWGAETLFGLTQPQWDEFTICHVTNWEGSTGTDGDGSDAIVSGSLPDCLLVSTYTTKTKNIITFDICGVIFAGPDTLQVGANTIILGSTAPCPVIIARGDHSTNTWNNFELYGDNIWIDNIVFACGTVGSDGSSTDCVRDADGVNHIWSNNTFIWASNVNLTTGDGDSDGGNQIFYRNLIAESEDLAANTARNLLCFTDRGPALYYQNLIAFTGDRSPNLSCDNTVWTNNFYIDTGSNATGFQVGVHRGSNDSGSPVTKSDFIANIWDTDHANTRIFQAYEIYDTTNTGVYVFDNWLNGSLMGPHCTTNCQNDTPQAGGDTFTDAQVWRTAARHTVPGYSYIASTTFYNDRFDAVMRAGAWPSDPDPQTKRIKEKAYQVMWERDGGPNTACDEETDKDDTGGFESFTADTGAYSEPLDPLKIGPKYGYPRIIEAVLDLNETINDPYDYDPTTESHARVFSPCS